MILVDIGKDGSIYPWPNFPTRDRGRVGGQICLAATEGGIILVVGLCALPSGIPRSRCTGVRSKNPCTRSSAAREMPYLEWMQLLVLTRIEYGEEGKHNVQDQTHGPHCWHQIMIMVCLDPERQMCNKEHAWYKHKNMQYV
jgi:hypothetical protein